LVWNSELSSIIIEASLGVKMEFCAIAFKIIFHVATKFLNLKKNQQKPKKYVDIFASFSASFLKNLIFFEKTFTFKCVQLLTRFFKSMLMLLFFKKSKYKKIRKIKI
jgi:hypothetical protein